MAVISEDQDALLKQYNDLQNQEKSEIYPEKILVNYGLIFLSVFISLLLLFYIFWRNEYYHIPYLLSLSLLLVAGLFSDSKGKKIGGYIASATILFSDAYVSSITLNSDSDFLALMDGITIAILSNAFGKKGFIIATTLISTKMILINLLIPNNRYLHQLVGPLVTANTIGISPLVIKEIAISSLKAEKQKIRARILLIQNQDLLQSWKNFKTQ